MDYGGKCDKVHLLCDNESAIKIADNPVKIAEPSILIFVIIFFEIMWHENTLRSFMWAPRSNSRIFSRSHLMKQG